MVSAPGGHTVYSKTKSAAARRRGGSIPSKPYQLFTTLRAKKEGAEAAQNRIKD